MEYIDSLAGPEDNGCFLCRYREHPEYDQANLVLWRGEETFVVMNRFPYSGGHALIAPQAHLADMDGFGDSLLLELMHMVRDTKAILAETINPYGFNVGINLGRCAGAGLPDHLHIHVVPRWPGDTNFMAVLGGVRVIPTTLEKLYQQLRETGRSMGLPKAAIEDAGSG
jgi:ATP adenylyltransferase